MCGICGSFGFAGLTDEDISATRQMIKLMDRRGPDGEGFWTDGKHGALGFRRLAILDLSSAGHQPMLTPDRRFVLIHNGEVYNFYELRKELEHKGIQFRSTGDTEVVLHVLAQGGREALNRLNGMFALALYDATQKRLLIARDHAGIKPLYYLLSSKGLVFASQYDQIMAHPWAKRLQVSTEAMALYLRLGYIPAPYGLLSHTYMLEPGTWLEVNSEGQVKKGKFFTFPVFREPDLRGEEAYEAVNDAVTKAVRRHLVSDVPLGTFLSGGIDSPLVVAKIREANNGSFRAFTIGTNGDSLDESPDAIAYAREMGVDHIVEQVTPELAVGMLDDVIAACGEPFSDYSVFPTMIIARLARQHVKVILSGDGGDELFWGYPSRFARVLGSANNFRRPYWYRLLRWGMTRGFRGWYGMLRWGMRRVFRERKGSHLFFRSIGEFYRTMHTRIGEDHLNAIFPELPQWPPEFRLFDYSSWELSKTAQWMRWNEFLGHLTMVLLKVDRASMYHSLEVRVPLLDRGVVDVAARVDWASCLDMKEMIGKLPLRHALARHVNQQTQTKRGFTVPMNIWLRGPLKAIFEDVLLGQREILGMPLNQRELQKIFQDHISNRSDLTWGLWLLLSLALWKKRHYDVRFAMLDAGKVH